MPKSTSFSFMQCLYKNDMGLWPSDLFLIRVIPDLLLLYFRRLDTVDVPCHNHGLIGFYLVYLASWTIPRYFFTYLQSFQTSLHINSKTWTIYKIPSIQKSKEIIGAVIVFKYFYEVCIFYLVVAFINGCK